MILLTDYLTEARLAIYEGSATKNEVLKHLISLLSSAPEMVEVSRLEQEIWEREALMSTGIGMGIGIPHVKSSCVTDLVMAMAVCRNPVGEYESLDGLPVHFVVMIAAPADAHRLYLQTLAKVAFFLKSDKRRLDLLRASDPLAVMEILRL